MVNLSCSLLFNRNLKFECYYTIFVRRTWLTKLQDCFFCLGNDEFLHRIPTNSRGIRIMRDIFICIFFLLLLDFFLLFWKCSNFIIIFSPKYSFIRCLFLSKKPNIYAFLFFLFCFMNHFCRPIFRCNRSMSNDRKNCRCMDRLKGIANMRWIFWRNIPNNLIQRHPVTVIAIRC